MRRPRKACVCVARLKKVFCPTIKNMTAKPVTCKWCKQSIPSKTQYEAHAKTCRPFACGQCDEKFKSQTALREHTKKTHQQLIQCPLCDIDPFKSDAQLEEHCFRDHDMPIQCKFCDKTFTTPHKRDAHMKMKHCDSSDFKCPCGYSFPDQHKLKIHQEGCVLSKKGATVAIKRKFAELCANTEDRNAACTQAFSEIRAEAQTRLECRCSHCGVCFASKDSLKRHIRYVREKARSSTDPA